MVWILFFFLVLFCEAKMENSYQEEIDRQNEEIRYMGLKWKAGITSITILSPEEKKRRLGALEPIIDDSNLENLFQYFPRAVPNLLDWRNKNNKNWLTPVKDQGSCGSCSIFGSFSVLEAVLKIEKNMPDNCPDLSEQHILSCSGAVSCEEGGYVEGILDYVKSKGVPAEHCFSYTAEDKACYPCSNWEERRVKIGKWEWVTSGREKRNLIFNALQIAPVITRMEVYSDFYDYKEGIYEKTPSATEEGGHIVAIVGYNQAEGYWICKNSWGTGWGEDGYFRISFGEVEMGKYTWNVSQLKIIDAPPIFEPIGNQNIDEGKLLAFRVFVVDGNNDPLIYRHTQLPEGANFDSQFGQFTWMPTYYQSGIYNMVFYVSDGILESVLALQITVNEVKNIKKGKGRF
jgi:hypothetical protein